MVSMVKSHFNVRRTNKNEKVIETERESEKKTGIKCATQVDVKQAAIEIQRKR